MRDDFAQQPMLAVRFLRTECRRGSSVIRLAAGDVKHPMPKRDSCC
jgi:hypothetical protein